MFIVHCSCSLFIVPTVLLSSLMMFLLLGLSRLLLSVPQSRPLRLPPRLAPVQEHPTWDGHPDKVHILLIKWILSILISMKVSAGAGLGPKT